jgi:CYTH domain-containing protein
MRFSEGDRATIHRPGCQHDGLTGEVASVERDKRTPMWDWVGLEVPERGRFYLLALALRSTDEERGAA